MSFSEAVRSVFRKWNKTDGRASRSEYWWFVLFTIIAPFAFAVVLALLGTLLGSIGGALLAGVLSIVFVVAALFVIIPTLTVSIRRLHDTNRSGWWLLLNLIPVGSLILLIFYVLDGTHGPNNYGDRPGGNQPTAMPAEAAAL
jgi:uncharacterized membrane protein YhaH (DUF805 family)